MRHHLRAELRACGQSIRERLSICEDAGSASRDRYGTLPDHSHGRAQRVLLLLDISWVVKQQPNESSVLAGEDDGGIHGGVGNGFDRRDIQVVRSLRDPRPDYSRRRASPRRHASRAQYPMSDPAGNFAALPSTGVR